MRERAADGDRAQGVARSPFRPGLCQVCAVSPIDNPEGDRDVARCPPHARGGGHGASDGVLRSRDVVLARIR